MNQMMLNCCGSLKKNNAAWLLMIRTVADMILMWPILGGIQGRLYVRVDAHFGSGRKGFDKFV